MPTTLAEELQLEPGLRARLVNVPKSVRSRLEPLPAGVHLNEAGAEAADWLLLFARDRAALDTFATVAVSEVKYDGLLWIACPAALPRAVAEQAMAAFGFEAVAAVPVDGGWTALRFRPKERLGH